MWQLRFLCFQCWPAKATDQNCTKLPACVDAVLSQPRQMEAGTTSALPALVGFLAQLFSMSPEEKQRILAGASSQPFKVIELFALYRAGLADDARICGRKQSRGGPSNN